MKYFYKTIAITNMFLLAIHIILGNTFWAISSMLLILCSMFLDQIS